MTLSVRRLGPDDAEAARQLGMEAFGFPSSPPTSRATIDQPGMIWFGAFEDDLLVAQLVDREFDAYFGGVPVSMCGVAGVTVAAEHRGQGILTPLFDTLLRSAKQRGALISALFPSAPGIYRRFGYEPIAEYVRVEVPTSILAAVPRPPTIRTRRAAAADFDAIRALYDAWAIEQNGPLSRQGVSFSATAEDFIASNTGVTVALDRDGSVCGFVSWRRGEGVGIGASIKVSNLLARSADAYRALLSMIGSFASVTPSVKIDTSGDDLARLFLPSAEWKVIESFPYMLSILDVAESLAMRRYPPSMTTTLRFQVDGHFLTENNRAYELTVKEGRAACSDADHADRTFSPQGLALLYTGAQSCANLRLAGHLAGGDLNQDLDWDAMLGGRQRHIRDYF
ncbi:MAG TPA: GNAT family N-acetyltransferase [Propionibacteriaceae bacterium]